MKNTLAVPPPLPSFPRKRKSRPMRFILLLTALCSLLTIDASASSGCNYPGSLDTWANKTTGDSLTVADVNQFRCAIEKLEAGPIRVNKGTAAAPAYSFQGDTGTGMDSVDPTYIDFFTQGVRSAQIAHVTNAVNYPIFVPSTTGNPVGYMSSGSDTNIGVMLATSGTGDHIFSGGSGSIARARIYTESGGPGILLTHESSTDHVNGAANTAKFFTKDNGAGKTQACVRFATGAAVCYATEP